MSEENLPELKKSTLEKKPSAASVFLKSILVMVFVVATIVALSWSFGWVAVEKYNPEELFDKYQSSRPESRTLILVEWMRVLSQKPNDTSLHPTSAQEERFRFDLQNLKMEESAERSLASPLISLLGFSQNKTRTLEVFSSFAERVPAHQGLEAQIALVFAMARLGLWSVPVENFISLSAKDSDAAVRKSVAYVLGSQPEWPAEFLKARLYELFNDSVEDVKWNAALSMSRLGYSDADAFLMGLLQKIWSPEFQKRSAITLVEEQLYAQLFSTLAKKPNQEFKTELEKVATKYPHVKLRMLALQALKD